MDKHRRDLVRELFTLATMLLEDAHEPTMKGQGVSLTPAQYRTRADRLFRTAKDLESVAGSIGAALRTELTGHPRVSIKVALQIGAHPLITSQPVKPPRPRLLHHILNYDTISSANAMP